MRNGNKKDERGIASIVISMTIIIVVSLIVLGFSGLMRRSNRQALDQQLSNQAFFAAESAVNEKVADILANLDNLAGLAINTCTPDADFFSSPAGSVVSTCVLVDPYPKEFVYDGISSNDSTLVVLRPAAGENSIRTVRIEWEMPGEKRPGENGVCSVLGYDNNPSSLGANDLGYLRIDLVDTSTYAREFLRERVFSAVLKPRGGGDLNKNYSYDIHSGTPVVFGSCSDTSEGALATARITNLDSNSFLLRMKGVFKTSQVTVRAQDSNGDDIRLDGGQVVIDSTARVEDVVRRVQARLPIGFQAVGIHPDFALRTAEDICKLLTTEPDSTLTDSCN